MAVYQRAALAATLVLAAGAAVGQQTTQTTATPVATPAAAKPPPDPCAPSQYAGDKYAPTPAFPGQTGAPALAPSKGYVVQTIASGLVRPRSIVFLGDGSALVSEGGSRLRVLSKSGSLSAPIAGTPEALPESAYEIVLDRGFSKNRTLYLAFRAPKPGEVVPEGRRAVGIGRVFRARLALSGDHLEDSKLIHEGGYLRRMLQLPDGTLLLTTTGAVGDIAQRLGEGDGKVLRINADGSIPKDNPFVGKAGARPELYSIGHRDPDGITRDPATGRIWLSEHGPRGGDEINVIKAGANYGFPVITYGRDYSGEQIDGGLTAKAGMEQPVYYWTPDIAPSGMAVYRGAMFPRWTGDLFVTALVGKKLVRLAMKGGKVSGEEAILSGRCERYRDVRQAPDGSLYVLTDQDPGAVLRISRAP